MSLSTPIYRLKPQSGDSTPHDETTTGADLSGGTITLVDRGSGDYVWRCVGAAAAAIASRTIAPAASGGGVTFAVRMAVTTWPGGSFDVVAGYGTSAGGVADCYGFTAAGANVIRGKHFDSADDVIAMLTVNTSIRTYVCKIVMQASGSVDKLYIWIDTVGRSGSTASYISSGQNYNADTYAKVLIGNTGSTIDCSDFVIWGEELSDADCAALADTGIRATLDAGGPQTLTPGLYTNTNTFYAPTVAPGAVDLTPSLFTNTNAFYSATVSLSGGAQSLTPGLFSNTNTFHAATVARVPGFLTPVLKNNSGTVLASETGVACNVYNASTGALVVRKTGLTSSAAGIVSVTDAAMAAGTTYAYEIVLSAARRLPVAAA